MGKGDIVHKYLLDTCFTCKNLPQCEKHIRKSWGDHFEKLIYEFVCDFYKRKNSGAFRRHCRKERREHEQKA